MSSASSKNIALGSKILLLCMILPSVLLAENLQPLTITTSNGARTYQVEVARTEAEQARGLMHRTTLPDNHGMIFLSKRPRLWRMWMRNTLIPLDILFIGEGGIIKKIHRNAKPMDETIISSGAPVIAVLELNAGQVSQHNIAIGDHIRVDLKP